MISKANIEIDRNFVLTSVIVINCRRKINARPGRKESGSMIDVLAKNEYIPYGSPTLELYLENFVGNKQEIADLCWHNNVRVILFSGLKPASWPPFNSESAARMDSR